MSWVLYQLGAHLLFGGSSSGIDVRIITFAHPKHELTVTTLTKQVTVKHAVWSAFKNGRSRSQTPQAIKKRRLREAIRGGR